MWVIERRVSGAVKAIALDALTEEDALAELVLFDRDPASYRTKKQTVLLAAEQAERAAADAVVLTPELHKEFIEHARKEGLNKEYVEHILGNYLSHWGVALNGRDMREVTLLELRKMLKGWKTAEHHRIVALKSFASWLREEGKLHRSNDPTLDLLVPQAKPEKSVRVKGYAMSEVEAVYAEVPSQLLRDTLCLRAKASMHDTEIARVARGEAVLREVDDPCGIKGTVTFFHKRGDDHVVSLDAQAFAAALRLQARKRPLTRAPALLMLKRAANRLREKCETPEEREKIRVIAPGEIRHSFSNWASDYGVLVRPTKQGLPVEEVAAVMGHRSTKTTRTFYKRVLVPPMIQLPLNLIHPEDPPIASRTADLNDSNEKSVA
ncbi:site-specific integrase [Myxococcus llanfairpwllgwyngyllgogerychwyrndrobwllllantysiliogogogochensis]|uniref:Site-specific integrase n=1 Tax=Myxococcus llanfairpwllgwyngyllgogerychwyrndrobwllllantysiliogogogochensis TaxID=2590453 RepID=A0A540WTX8_9BACT|nr:site-specific integrase [Myxococcus llanfairpwllgwyngyllgogerychwyrndrobwllllantysiliogogogochensis]